MREGRPGRDGLPGERGLQGKQGQAGRDGRDGLSALELAKSRGFAGDEDAFLASLKGERGLDGAQGEVGPDGREGIAGKDGAPGRNGIDGEPGRTGKTGAQGPQGQRGPEGPMGPMPRHVWEGTILRFELPSGQFDDGVDLRGPAGKAGRDGIGGGGGNNSGGLPDAPSDGNLYGRMNAAWVVAIGDAPSDGSPYWRKDGAWVVAVTGGGATWGAIVGDIGDQSDLGTALALKQDVSGLGTAAFAATGDFASAAQGATADSAVQPGDLAAVALSGAYSDLTGKPSLATVATTGAYSDLTGKPTLGTAAASATTDFATAAQGAKADSALQPANVSSFSIAWSQLTSTPTTLSGYGITDAESSSHASSTYATITNLALKAALASPALTGTPTAPTASNGTNTTQIATCAFVLANAGSGGGSWGSITGTLSSQTDLQSALDLKAPLASPALTGTPTVPTAAANTNTTQAASCAFVIANSLANSVIAADNSVVTVSGTSKTTVYSFTLPAGALGTARTMRLELAGEHQRSGTSGTFQVEVKIGSTVLWTDASGSTAQISALLHPWFLSIDLSAAGATNAQFCSGQLIMGGAVAATTGNGDAATVPAATTGAVVAFTGSAAEDQTTNLTVTVSVTMATTSTTLTFIKRKACAYMLGAGATGAQGATGSTGATGGISSVCTALTPSAGVVNIDCSLGNYFTILGLAATVTSLTFSNVPASGNGTTLSIIISQDGTGGRTFALPASFHKIGTSNAAIGSAASVKTQLVITTVDGGTTWNYAMQNIA